MNRAARTFTVSLLGLAAMTLIYGCDQPAPSDPSVANTQPAAQRAPGRPASSTPAPLGEVRMAPAGPPAVEDLTMEQIEAQYSPDLEVCLNTGAAADGVSVAMGGCFHTELQAQDVRLNAAYRSVMEKLDQPARARLRDDERAWIRDRDGQCQAEATGGTIDMVDIPHCILDETIRRRIALERLG